MTTQRNHNPRRHLAICNHQSTMSLPPSIEIDTMRQSPTNHNENSCPRVTRERATTPTHVIPAPTKVIPAPTNVIPAKAGIFSLGMDCAQARSGIDVSLGSCRPRAVIKRNLHCGNVDSMGKLCKDILLFGPLMGRCGHNGFSRESSSFRGILCNRNPPRR